MPSSKRQPHPKMYDTCRTCEYNVSSYGKCKRGFDNFYFRRGKHNGCLQCLQCLNGKAATGNSMQMRAHSECTTVKANKCLRSLKKRLCSSENCDATACVFPKSRYRIRNNRIQLWVPGCINMGTPGTTGSAAGNGANGRFGRKFRAGCYQ